MKRTSIIIGFILMTALPLTAAHVTPKTARQVATTFLNNNGAKAAQLTDLTKAAGFPNLYIFNAEEGFVVMSADDCVRPILGYSLTGTFKVEDMPENISSWLQSYSDGIQGAIDHQMRASDETAKLWKDLEYGKTGVSKATPIVAEILQTKWNQGSPYNNLCPLKGSTRTVTGCVATAMAQVMKFWNHPTTGTGSHSYTWNSQTLNANFSATTYDWTNMTNTYSSSSTAAQKTAVATLMYHCGVSLEMDYNTSGSGGSGASTYDVMYALQTYFDYCNTMQYLTKDDYEEAVWIAMLKTELDNGRPMQYRGSDAGGGGGHSFVCDGYDSDDCFHFNWGWAGYCDGYYSVNDMEPGTGGIGAGNGVYTVGQSAIFGIEPNSTLAAPTLSASLDQTTVTLTWNAVTDATSYDVYKDNVKVGTGLTTTTYVDSGLEFGVYHDYYVRAVSSSTQSNPSNTVTKCSLYRDITPSNLTVALQDNDTELSWTGYPGGLSTDLHYGVTISDYTYGFDDTQSMYWGQRYPVSTLSQLNGMQITKVSNWFFLTGNYTMYLYSGNLDESTRTKLAEQTYHKSQQKLECIDFTLSTPIEIDCSKDLWVVFYSNSNNYPILFDDEYYEDNADDAKFLSKTLDELFTSASIDTYDISWLIRTYVSDGTYTYNLYDGDTKINSTPVTGTTYTHANPTNNTVHQYTVKTNGTCGESEASNTAGIVLGTVSLETLNLSADASMTVTSGSTLTVSGALSNTEAANLIIEDGAQLVHNTAGVKATVKKNAEAYTSDDNGWYFIASPVMENITPSVANGLISGSYDLYYYNEPNQLWKNYKAAAFNLVSKQGYLYANNTNTTLKFEGTLTPSNSPVSLTGLSHSASELNGFNLVGNPFACNATINQDCYVIDGGNVVLASSAKTIAPGEGVFVKATSDEYTVTFSRSGAKSNESPASLDLVLTQKERTLDRVRVRLNEGVGMEKFNLEGQEGARLTISQNGQDYAVAYLEASNELPLDFKAVENGTYTLRMEDLGLQLEYLHLVDHLTGADIDLLQCPSYSFEAQTSDYEAMFQLRFTEDIPAGDDFEFIDGKTQILDLTGRVVATHRHTQLAPGIYLLRTVNGNETSTQKIIIK
ncbi:MAG: C10 family peptidase [Bacteroidales bacterium]|nr:C10 family peptidase [Bacteroidales bacterium]